MGLRIMSVKVELIERMVREGTDRCRPLDVPPDLMVIQVRLNLLEGLIDCVVHSAAFDNDDRIARDLDHPYGHWSVLFDQLPRWSPTFRRVELEPDEAWPGWRVTWMLGGRYQALCRHCHRLEVQLEHQTLEEFKARCQAHAGEHRSADPPIELPPEYGDESFRGSARDPNA